jgi:hypothetical protein
LLRLGEGGDDVIMGKAAYFVTACCVPASPYW